MSEVFEDRGVLGDVFDSNFARLQESVNEEFLVHSNPTHLRSTVQHLAFPPPNSLLKHPFHISSRLSH